MVFGGWSTGTLGDTGEYDGNNWSDFREGGQPAPGRSRHYRNPLLRVLDRETDLFDAETIERIVTDQPHRLAREIDQLAIDKGGRA